MRKTQRWTLCLETTQSSIQAKLKKRRHPRCFIPVMLSRIARLDFSLWEMVGLSLAVGLLAALTFAVQVG